MAVEYVDPQIPEPSAAVRAAAEAALRQWRAQETSIRRSIVGSGTGGTIAVAVGDSAWLSIDETRCDSDLCGRGRANISDSAWSVVDSTVARVRPARLPVNAVGAARRRPRAVLVGVRPGRTRVRVAGVHGPSDTVPSRDTVRSEIEVEVVVIRPVARVRISPRPATVRARATVAFRARLLDGRGRAVRGVHAQLMVQPDTGIVTAQVARGPLRVRFDHAGRTLVVARFAGIADTVVVTVLPR